MRSLQLALALLPLLLSSAVSSETVHGAVIFSRHGDRTWKDDPPTRLTALGQNQLFRSGSYYRDRYIDGPAKISGIKPEYDASHVYASSPDQAVLMTSGYAFLQGLYPPISSPASEEKLANGSEIAPPLQGYQYSALHTIPDTSSDTIYLKGDDSCPMYDFMRSAFFLSAQYQALENSTMAFYRSLMPDILDGVFSPVAVGYHNAYSIYDYINVGVTHNSTIAKRVSSQTLAQLRTLADSREFALNGNITSDNTVLAISGQTLAAKVLSLLETNVHTAAKEKKLSVLVGSYNTFLSFFALTSLTSVSANFTGLPDYASTMVFELFSNTTTTDTYPKEQDLHVRFLFRNGTEADDDATEYPLFNHRRPAAMPWREFRESMQRIAIRDVWKWCMLCNSNQEFCEPYWFRDPNIPLPPAAMRAHRKKLSAAVAGVVGAISALGFVSLLAAAAVLGFGLRVQRKNVAAGGAVGKEEKKEGEKKEKGEEEEEAFHKNRLSGQSSLDDVAVRVKEMV